MDTKLLKSVLKEQIANPCKAIVNSESAFVKDKLIKAGHDNLANAYWKWVCMGKAYNPGFNTDIVELQNQLNQIDRKSRQNVVVNSRFD